MDKAKFVLASKTLNANTLLGVVAPAVAYSQGMMSKETTIATIVVAVLNIVLRFLTKGPVTLKVE